METTEKEGAGAGIAGVMKWVGVAALLISFGSAVYELVHAEGELRERERIVREQLAAGRTQQTAGDFASAWQSFGEAAKSAATDGLFAKLRGGLDVSRRQVQAAQQDLAMAWVRDIHVAEGHSFSETADKLVNVLAAGSNSTDGPRKADLLAHLGWAYFLKMRDGDGTLKPENEYREAVAADAGNPYAHVFWGHWILWNHGSLDEALERFKIAVAANRARPEVRHFELSAFVNGGTEAASAAWWRAVDDMRNSGEPVDADIRNALDGRYFKALYNDDETARLVAALPPAEHLKLLHWLLGQNPADRPTLMACTARMYEAAGQPAQALTVWRSLLSDGSAEPHSTLADRSNAAIRALSAGPNEKARRSK